MSATINFESLSLIPKLLEKIESLESELKEIKKEVIPELDLTKRAGVKKFLNCSDSTIHKMMCDGRLKQGIHYFKEIKGRKVKIVFIESGIRAFKEKEK